MSILAGFIVVIGSLLGVVLTVLGLPGIWCALLIAVLCQWWQGDLFSPWTLFAVAGVALVGEILELVASSMGAAKAGGTRRGAVGALVGGIVGAIAGLPFLPPIGPVLGSAAGAGLGALLAERHGGNKTWSESARIGTGAAIGRLSATLIKVMLAIVVVFILGIAVCV